MEILYLSEAKRIDVRLPEVINLTLASTNYAIVSIDAEIVLAAATIDDVPELHDRILVATANSLGVPLLTSDKVIASSKHVQVIW
jgi:PIN domain nuclease of toxin-antitoxin system